MTLWISLGSLPSSRVSSLTLRPSLLSLVRSLSDLWILQWLNFCINCTPIFIVSSAWIRGLHGWSYIWFASNHCAIFCFVFSVLFGCPFIISVDFQRCSSLSFSGTGSILFVVVVCCVLFYVVLVCCVLLCIVVIVCCCDSFLLYVTWWQLLSHQPTWTSSHLLSSTFMLFQKYAWKGCPKNYKYKEM